MERVVGGGGGEGQCEHNLLQVSMPNIFGQVLHQQLQISCLVTLSCKCFSNLGDHAVILEIKCIKLTYVYPSTMGSVPRTIQLMSTYHL